EHDGVDAFHGLRRVEERGLARAGPAAADVDRGRGRLVEDHGGDAGAEALAFRSKGKPGSNTTLAVVATDAKLSKAQCKRLAVMAQSGLSRAIYPVHTPLDGDVVFAAALGAKPLPDPVYSLSELGMLAGNVLARAIARGVYEAKALPFPSMLPSWREKFG
ncbi:MAG TPA: P1 family peptidase, partial [Pseudolabrys sp.]|nr:P1 family peptidase [Pseudolabrys sp.]